LDEGFLTPIPVGCRLRAGLRDVQALSPQLVITLPCGSST
jgi:hypothetical protein